MYNIDIDDVIEKYSDNVYRLAYSMVKNKSDADDVYQEVFLRLIKTNKSFNNDEHLKAWLYRVTINCVKKLYASAWRRNTVQTDEFEFGEYNDEHFELLDTVNQLPLKYKTVIHLFYYENLSIEEVAKLTKQKQSTVRTQLTRARKLLKERLE